MSMKFILLALIFATVAACGGSDKSPRNDNPPNDDDPGTPTGFVVSGTVSGLLSDEITIVLSGDGETGRPIQTVTTGNGPFAFPDRVPDGAEFLVFLQSPPQSPPQYCGVEGQRNFLVFDSFDPLSIQGADLTVDIVCEDRFFIGGDASGIGDRPLQLDIDLEVNGEHTTLHSLIDKDGPYHSVQWLLSGWNYTVTIDQATLGDDRQCEISNPVGVIEHVNKLNVDVTCKTGPIGGEIIGLAGSGLEVTLSYDPTNGGASILLDVESLMIAENGPFEFEATLGDGVYYEVAVRTQPSDPEQTCTVDNGSGIVAGPIADIVVRCTSPRRVYVFHDVDSIATVTLDDPLGQPVKSGDRTGPAFLDYYDYPVRNAVPFTASAQLGEITTLPVEIFDDYLDRDPLRAPIFSSDTGKTYWLAVGSGSIGNTPTTHNQARLWTTWQMKKRGEEARFELSVTQATLLAFIDTLANNLPLEPHVESIVTLAFNVEVLRNGSWQRVHRQSASASLFGELDGLRPLWTFTVDYDASTTQELFSGGNFLQDNQFGVPSGAPNSEDRVGLMMLQAPLPVVLDLSEVAVGEEFRVIADASVTAVNASSGEGAAVAYLRDPAEFDPGTEPELAGVSVVEMSGVELLPVEDTTPEELLLVTPAPLPECADASAERSVLEFSRPAYVFYESTLPQTLNRVEVVRGGTTVGRVGATVTATNGSAVIGEDFRNAEQIVRFGDDNAAPRTLEFAIIDDGFEEDDESFTITLHSPEGCAEIGPQSTATVTILANDPNPGALSFASGAIDIDEAAGEALLEVVRTGGDAGLLIGSVSTQDGTALAGEHYVQTTDTVVFADGDVQPKFVRVPIIDDAIPEADTSFTAELTSERGVVAPPRTLAVTIRDDDSAATSRFRFGSAFYQVDETAGTVSIEIQRLDSAVGSASVDVRTAAGTAQAGVDFVELLTTITFADGDDTPKTVDIPIIDDTDAEGDERFSVALVNPVNGVLGLPDSIAVTIVDDESTPVVPPAPTLNVTPGIGQLEFTWTSLAEATYYRLMESPDGISPFVQIGGDIPAGQSSYQLPVAVHLLDWDAVRFLVQACNSAGCTDSNDVSVVDAMLGAIGFFKASNTDNDDAFGYVLDISDDGLTIAVGAPEEDSDAVLINGDQSNNNRVGAGAVYVFVHEPDGWVQQAYIKPPYMRFGMAFGTSLALSADGNRLVVGAPEENGTASGVGGDYTSTSYDQTGAVYVYERSGAVWTFARYIKASNPGRNDKFGHAVALSDDGATLLVGAPYEDNAATGIEPPDQTDDSAADAGAIYVFEHDGSDWAQTAYIKASNAEAGDRFGDTLAISGDSTRFAVSAFDEDSAATGINGDEADNSAPGSGSRYEGTGAVYLFARQGGLWSQEAYIKASNTDPDDQFGAALALNGDGSLLAVGATREDSAGTGAGSTAEQDNSAAEAGAVYVFSRVASVWQQDAYIKASNTRNLNLFGSSLDFSDDGTLLAIGAPLEGSLAIGINGDETQLSRSGYVGAVYVYRHDIGTGNWQKLSYVKATNSDQDGVGGTFGRTLGFGWAVALSADGQNLAVSAIYDGSNATGIGGDASNIDATYSGAMFLY